MRGGSKVPDSYPANGKAIAPPRNLGGTRPVKDRARPGGLKSPSHMEVTVGVAFRLRLSAEVEVWLQGVAERPAAVVGQKRDHRLPLAGRNGQVVGLKGQRRALVLTHKKIIAQNSG